MRQTGRVVFFAIFSLTLCFCGCVQEEPIRTYVVPKVESIQLATKSTEPIGDPTDRVLGAIVLKGERAWFFKGVGKLAEFSEKSNEAFDAFVTSLKFDGEKPSWTLPADWVEKPGSGMRVANLMMGDVEISVIPLPLNDGNERSYLLSNVNRWRKQLSLGPLTSVELSKASYKLTTSDGLDAMVVDFEGNVDAGAMPPFAGGGGRAPFAPQGPPRGPAQDSASRPAASSAPKSLTYDVPDGWSETAAGAFGVAAFSVSEGDGQASVAVSKLRGSGGDFLPNVNRWRGQVGMAPLDDEDSVDFETLQIGGKDARLVMVEGDTESMSIAVIPADTETFFIKLRGNSGIVANQEAAFRAFLDSVNFP